MKSPAFRFYPADFMGSPDVAMMDLHEVGAYVFLLCMAWQSDRHGYLPDDEGKLRRLAKMTLQQWEDSREILLGKFPVAEPGWRSNPRMVLEAEKQATYSAVQSEKGKKGGRPKKLEVLQTKAGAFTSKAGVKPSVSVSVSVSVSGSKEPKQLLSFPSGKMNAKAGSARQSKQRRSYDPLFQQVWAVYPKAEEKAESAEEWPKALERLQEGEPDLEPMTPAEAANFLEQAAIDYSSKMHGREARYIRSMRRWLNNRTYLDYKQQPKVEYHDISYDQAFAEHLPTGSEGR